MGEPNEHMSVVVLLLGTMLVLGGCSSESAKRTAFETLQNLGEQQCTQGLSGKCPPRESYADYQRKRDEAQSSETHIPPVDSAP